MANSLLDMFQPTDPAGQQTDFGGALASRGNAMIGMGMGLLKPYFPGRGESPYTNALEGFQTGAVTDLASARTQQQMRIEQARLRLEREQANGEPEAVRLWKLSENNPAMREALFPKAGQDWSLWTNPEDDQTYWISKKGEAHPFRLGQPPPSGGAPAAGATPQPFSPAPAPTVDTG